MKEPEKKITKVLFDGDLLCYQASSSVQKDIDWGDGLYTCHAFLGDAQDVLYSTLNGILKDIEGYLSEVSDVEYYFMFSGDKNFRKTIDPNYKGNRANKRKPTCYHALIESLYDLDMDHLAILSEEYLEGDDLLGIYATRYPKDSLIVSMDKDFKTVPCYFYNYGTKKLLDTHNEYLYWLAFQTLTGDTTDNYFGCKGVGKVKAKNILDSYEGDYWKAIVDTYKKAGMTEEDAIRNLRLAHILWDGDYDFVKKEVLFSNPYIQQ